MKNVFKNFGYAIATAIVVLVVSSLQPGNEGPIRQAQATGSCSGGEITEVVATKVVWEDDDEISWQLSGWVRLGGASSGTLVVYEIDDNGERIEPAYDEIVFASDGSLVISEEDDDRTDKSYDWLEFEFDLERSGCTTITSAVAFPKPNITVIPVDNGVDIAAKNKEVVNGTRLDVDVEIGLENGTHDDITVEFEYRDDDDDVEAFTSIDPVTQYGVHDSGKPETQSELMQFNPAGGAAEEQHQLKIIVKKDGSYMDHIIVSF